VRDRDSETERERERERERETHTRGIDISRRSKRTRLVKSLLHRFAIHAVLSETCTSS
jgi:hypothetical protein